MGEKNKKNVINFSSAELAQRVVRFSWAFNNNCLSKKHVNSGIFFYRILDVHRWLEFTISVGRLFSLILFLTPVTKCILQ